MTEKVLAVHTVTGIISEVLPSEIECIPALQLATQDQIIAAKAQALSDIYGTTNPVPAETATVIPEDGAANG